MEGGCSWHPGVCLDPTSQSHSTCWPGARAPSTLWRALPWSLRTPSTLFCARLADAFVCTYCLFAALVSLAQVRLFLTGKHHRIMPLGWTYVICLLRARVLLVRVLLLLCGFDRTALPTASNQTDLAALRSCLPASVLAQRKTLCETRKLLVRDYYRKVKNLKSRGLSCLIRFETAFVRSTWLGFTDATYPSPFPHPTSHPFPPGLSGGSQNQLEAGRCASQPTWRSCSRTRTGPCWWALRRAKQAWSAPSSWTRTAPSSPSRCLQLPSLPTAFSPQTLLFLSAPWPPQLLHDGYLPLGFVPCVQKSYCININTVPCVNISTAPCVN